MTAGLAQGWMRFWFAPAGPGNLGFCRLLFFAAFAWFYRSFDATRYPAVAEILWEPVWLFEALRLPVLSPQALAVLQAVWKASLVLCAIGLFTRLSTGVCFVLGIYLLGLGKNFGKIGHGDAILVWIFLILALSRSGDAWSIDALVRRWRLRGTPRARPEPSGEYTWPVKMIWLLMAIIFFAAGWAKVYPRGMEWILSDTIKNLLVQHHYINNPMTDLGLRIARYSLICKALAAFTIIVELFLPLALVHRYFRWVLVPGAFLMQVGISVLMDVNFTTFLICYLWWVPWDKVGTALARRLGGARRIEPARQAQALVAAS